MMLHAWIPGWRDREFVPYWVIVALLVCVIGLILAPGCSSAPSRGVACEPKASKPVLELRIFPPLGVSRPPEWGQIVHVTAELKGGMTEEFYCPLIEWIWQDGTVHQRGSDCAPWEATTEIPRRWSMDALWGPGLHHIAVRLLKAGRVIAHATADYQVLG